MGSRPDVGGISMTAIFEFLAPGAVQSQCHASSAKAVVHILAQIAEREYALSAAQIAERLVERERLGSTGFGSGIAIPHAKVDGLDHVVGVFLQMANPIEFKAVDSLPVDLIFCLLSPVDAGSLHLKALAQISRWLRDKAFVAKLRGAGSAEAIFALFAALDARDAA
jgi:nitrogen PTS system EIIA component